MKIPDAEMLRMILMLIDIDMPLATVESWTKAQRNEIADYAGAVRCDLMGKRIWKCSQPGGWKLLSKHESQAATTRVWNALMKDETRLAG